MHELGVAQSVVDAVLSEAEKNNAQKVEEINVDVGELMQIDSEALEKMLILLMKGPKLAGTRVRLNVQKASFSCRKCTGKWDMTEARKQLSSVPDDLLIREPDSKELPLHFLPYLYPAFLRCPKCGSSDIAVTQGEDIRLRKLIMK